ncbi:short chain dehydrogenase DHRS family protein [Schizosaccharomyces japonicus yFS275]|uniref:Short chain dehydrogenase DHRS family protein n=1 Tax=Schizosaccharomyces japonicus (strain yFS275 / FY16936) TaxID=402676 RepID=B6JW24_SCHJY|nr:short chain dehydrogenase DHRS family protein [Schizosaccharomyces japonicus yFS275]EEB05575.2 short chain dehydrogenase DHRS family protein [Schizosaccharomyces japonicus yFS275]
MCLLLFLIVVPVAAALVFSVFRLKNDMWRERCVVITGATGSLGRALCKICLQLGDQVIAVDVKDADSVKSVLSEVTATGAGVAARGDENVRARNVSSTGSKKDTEPVKAVDRLLTVTCDITKQADVDRLFQRIQESKWQPEVLVNAAAIAPKKMLLDSSGDELLHCLSVNVAGQLNVIRSLRNLLERAKKPHIINIASALAHFSAVGVGAYAASKAALLSVHETLENELRQQHSNIDMSLYSFGQFESPMFPEDTPNKFLAPILKAEDVAISIAYNIRKHKCGRHFKPRYVHAMPWMRPLPLWLQRIARAFSGMDNVYARKKED